MESYRGKKCIYMYNLSRRREIAFIGKVDYFGGQLLILIPKKKINLSAFVEYFNSEYFYSQFTFSGRFKIGQSQLCNCPIDLKLDY